jgi:phage N-6-adenine-methyltransferase
MKGYMPVAVTTEWGTPQSFFDKYNVEFHFAVDVAASDSNAKCARYYTKQTDGLAQDWTGEVCWMNPPYGRALPAWMKKAYESSLFGATVVCLVPSRTDARWWHAYAERGEQRFIKGRLKFAGAAHNAPFAVAIVVFRPPVQG